MTTDLPHGWSVRTIGSVAEVNPRRPSQLRTLRDDYPVTFVPMPAVDEDYGSIASAQTRPFGEVKKGFTYFAEGDVIFAKITPCMQNGKSAIATGLTNGLGFGSTEFHVLRAKPGATCPEWLWYFVRNPEFRAEATYHFQGAVGQQRVPVEFLADHQIPVPPLNEQRRIVARIRELMDRVNEVHTLRLEVRHDVARLFSSGLASVFREDWPSRRLEEVAEDIRNGWSGRELRAAPTVRVLRLSAVHTLTIDATESREVRVRPADRTAFGVRRGDVFVVRGNGSKHLVGRSAIAAGESAGVIFNDLLIRVTAAPSVMLPEFLNYCLHTPAARRQIVSSAKTAAGIWKVNQTSLGNVRIPCPSLDAQTQAVERARRLHECSRALALGVESPAAERLSAAVLRKAFGGEL